MDRERSASTQASDMPSALRLVFIPSLGQTLPSGVRCCGQHKRGLCTKRGDKMQKHSPPAEQTRPYLPQAAGIGYHGGHPAIPSGVNHYQQLLLWDMHTE